MKKFFLTAFLFYSCISYAQGMPPQGEVYSEVFTAAECLNAYEGTTCIVTGVLSQDNNAYHRDRYIIKDSTGEIPVRLSHHVVGNHNNIIGGTFKVTGELRGANHHLNAPRPPKHHNDGPHIKARYIEKQ